MARSPGPGARRQQGEPATEQRMGRVDNLDLYRVSPWILEGGITLMSRSTVSTMRRYWGSSTPSR